MNEEIIVLICLGLLLVSSIYILYNLGKRIDDSLSFKLKEKEKGKIYI